ncbi:(Fe-S)-binding protein [Marilutibacter alkalisoli]|uniref:Glycolate oxidase iron-sulfur subunit n=1 Tax=Marilutibacter alkalisoli TaxID=2591633 RepID=A0A514BUJ8_9GAMM|nr:(Fe-S)-binding protein [Lysobacter alkalisoli]QDH71060.1 (Fe-S)-binding protein [Lysobacter alkalisoli]
MPTPLPPGSLPAPDPLLALADRCVQCGLCLPACPTYARDRLEAESPRGRIALARALSQGTIAPTVATEAHLDHCLGCRSCEAVCPAGVEYGRLLVLARNRQRQRRHVGRKQQLIEALAARPARLTRLIGLYRTLFPLLPAMLRPVPRPPAPAALPSRSGSRPSVTVFIGCIARSYEAPLRAALARLLDVLDLDLSSPSRQTCCGSLHVHGGDQDRARALAEANRTAFTGSGTVLTLASGCHEQVAAAMPDGSETVDALVFLHRHGERLRFRRLDARIALHVPCTQRNVVGSTPALRDLLARVPGLDVVELAADCCGAAGTQMVTDPDRAAGFRQPLLDRLHASGATLLLSANIGCRLHLAGGTALPVQHPIELLAAQVD